MFTHARIVFLKETDATGVIYFTSLFQYAIEAFETLLSQKDSSLSQIFAKGYLMPIVHAEGDYKAPLKAGDQISVNLMLSHIGTKSFSIESKIIKLSDHQEAGSTKIVHAFMKKGEEVASELPQDLLSFLQNELGK